MIIIGFLIRLLYISHMVNYTDYKSYETASGLQILKSGVTYRMKVEDAFVPPNTEGTGGYDIAYTANRANVGIHSRIAGQSSTRYQVIKRTNGSVKVMMKAFKGTPMQQVLHQNDATRVNTQQRIFK